MSDYWINEYGHKEEKVREVSGKNFRKVMYRRSVIAGTDPTQVQVKGLFQGLEDHPFARLCIEENGTVSVIWWVNE